MDFQIELRWHVYADFFFFLIILTKEKRLTCLYNCETVKLFEQRYSNVTEQEANSYTFIIWFSWFYSH